jgi:hypothetical protein
VSKTVSEILDAAADLLEPEGAWTQEAFSRNADGSCDFSEDGDDDPIVAAAPVCWCALGAITAVTGEDPLSYSTFSVLGGAASSRARQFLNDFLDRTVEDWNDDPSRTQAEVVAKLREAAEKAREQGL